MWSPFSMPNSAVWRRTKRDCRISSCRMSLYIWSWWWIFSKTNLASISPGLVPLPRAVTLTSVHPPARPHPIANSQSCTTDSRLAAGKTTRPPRSFAIDVIFCPISRPLCWVLRLICAETISKSSDLPFGRPVKFGSLQTLPANPVPSFRGRTSLEKFPGQTNKKQFCFSSSLQTILKTQKA